MRHEPDPDHHRSATAIVEIFPELAGKINGHAVRVPLANASLTDIIFDVKRDTTAEEVNALLKEASQGELQGILGFEENRWCRLITAVTNVRPSLMLCRPWWWARAW